MTTGAPTRFLMSSLSTYVTIVIFNASGAPTVVAVGAVTIVIFANIATVVVVIIDLCRH
jgi:hypothetical protein